MIRTLIKWLTPPTPRLKRKPTPLTERELIRMESKVGGRLFGITPPDRRREFFCLDAKTWVWYEEWTNQETNQRTHMTTRYEIRGNAIIKIQNATQPELLQGEELVNFTDAVRSYYYQVADKVYRRPVMH